MASSLSIGPDGILRIHISGDLDRREISQFRPAVAPYLEASTAEAPLSPIIFANDIHKISLEGRQFFKDLFEDSRIGRFAIISNSTPFIVACRFIQNIGNVGSKLYFAEHETEAIGWIKNNDQELIT